MTFLTGTYRVPRSAAIVASLTVVGALVPVLIARVPWATEALSTIVTALIAVTVCLVVARLITEGWPGDRVVAVRPVRLHLAAIVVVVVLPALSVVTVLELAGYGRGAVFSGVLGWLLSGQILTAVCLSSRYQVATPAGYLVLAATFGVSAGQVRGWAWPLGVPTGAEALALGGPALAVALVVLAVFGPHPRR